MRCVRLFVALPKSTLGETLGKQFLRAGTSVAANSREASRARSNAEFVAKIGVVEQELDEALLLLELIVDAELLSEERMQALHEEAVAILKIVVTAIRRTKQKDGKPQSGTKAASREPRAAQADN
jgi:four helix bundle protein